MSWRKEIDNGHQMLACSSCGGRVIRLWYDRAVGDNGFRYCPYCGEEMDNWKAMIVPWPGYSENEEDGDAGMES